MKNSWSDKEICYDGSQLRSHWISENTGVKDDCIASFIGGADVPLSNMVDLEDVEKGEFIASKKMLHFIVEAFDVPLALAIARQRLLTCIACEHIATMSGARPVRRGDDIYIDDKKLSVSISTNSPISTLTHFALNITTEGTPIPTSSLGNLDIDPKEFSALVMGSFIREIESMRYARVKVRSVE